MQEFHSGGVTSTRLVLISSKVSNFDQTRISLVWYMSLQTPHDWSFMPMRMTRVRHASVLGLLFLAAIALQGCLAMAWLGAVGIDMSRTSGRAFTDGRDVSDAVAIHKMEEPRI
jgi:hypothetical protein